MGESTAAGPPADAAGGAEAQVATTVFEAVMEHRLPPGTKLTESALTRHFGVSRSVIRKALAQLAQQRIVELRPNRGARIACPSASETRAVFEARRLIEREIARSVAGGLGPRPLAELREAVAEEQRAAAAGDRHRLVRLSADFHVLLAHFTANEVLAGIVRDLVSRTSLVIALYEAPGAPLCLSDDHEVLVQCLQAGDAERAGALMTAHLEAIESRLSLAKRGRPVDLGEVFAAVGR